MFSLIYYIQKIYVYIVLKVYSYRIEKKEEKLQDLHTEIKYETENYRSLLYNAKWWAEELDSVKDKKHFAKNCEIKEIEFNKNKR